MDCRKYTEEIRVAAILTLLILLGFYIRSDIKKEERQSKIKDIKENCIEKICTKYFELYCDSMYGIAYVEKEIPKKKETFYEFNNCVKDKKKEENLEN
jgi:hypothetical protein